MPCKSLTLRASPGEGSRRGLACNRITAATRDDSRTSVLRGEHARVTVSPPEGIPVDPDVTPDGHRPTVGLREILWRFPPKNVRNRRRPSADA
jgi:hypothetical protein